MEQLDDIVRLAKKLITIPSVSGDIQKAHEILEIVKAELNKYKPVSFVSNHIPSLLFTNQETDSKQYKIILNGHLDVVPVETHEYTPREENGKLHGRGAFDMKGAAAVMILLFKELADKLSYPLGLQLTTDEELNGFNGTKYQIEQGVRTEFAIMGECNNNFQITNQAKGRSGIKLTTRGDAAHAAHPWRGKNAVWEMYQALEPLMKAFPIPEKETYETTVSITKIESENDAINKIPDSCSAYLDIRYKAHEQNHILGKIRSLLPADILFEPVHISYPLFTDPQTPYITMLRQITTEVIGKELPLRFAHATSDAPYYSKIGCPAVEFGPVGNSPHHKNEWVDIKSLGQYYEILKKFLLSVE